MAPINIKLYDMIIYYDWLKHGIDYDIVECSREELLGSSTGTVGWWDSTHVWVASVVKLLV